MNEIDDRLRSLADELSAEVDATDVQAAVERRAKGRRWVARARGPGIVALAILLTVGGTVLLTRVFRGSGTAAGPAGGPSTGAPSPGGTTPTASSSVPMVLAGSIAFDSPDAGLYVLTLGDGEPVKIMGGAGLSGLAWSPDGSRIALARGISEGRSQIVVANRSGGPFTVVVDFTTTGPERSAASYPTWSPDGSTIAFTTGPGDVYTVKADGSDLTQITDAARDGCADRRLSWSSDGTAILSARECEDRSASGIYALSPTGAAATLIVAMPGTSGVSASPDGTKVAFAIARKGVFVVGVDGMGLTQLTKGRDGSPTWSPDGAVVAFTRDYQVWAIPASGGEPFQVTTLDGMKVIDMAWTLPS
jgi:Tol biopolymer transport system component